MTPIQPGMPETATRVASLATFGVVHRVNTAMDVEAKSPAIDQHKAYPKGWRFIKQF